MKLRKIGEEKQSCWTNKATKSVVDCHVASTTCNLPDPNKFPLLHSLGICTTTHMDRLLQEIEQLLGSKSICFTHGNDRIGTPVVVPSNRTLEHFKEELVKPGSALDTMVECLTKSTNSTAEDAASCLLTVLFSKFEESFVSISIEKGLIEGNMPKKMDIIAPEAMVQEANINNTNARVLFNHLRFFFGGRSYFGLNRSIIFFLEIMTSL